MAVVPSPKVQLHDAMVPPSGSLLVLVNVHVSPVQLCVNDAVGAWFAVTCWVVVPVAPWLSVTVSVTLYVPSVAYARAAFWSVDVVPSPRVQLHATTLPSGSALVSVK